MKKWFGNLIDILAWGHSEVVSQKTNTAGKTLQFIIGDDKWKKEKVTFYQLKLFFAQTPMKCRAKLQQN